MHHIHITPHHSISPIQEQKTRQAYLTSFKSNSNQETRQAYLSIWRAADKDFPKTQKHERMETKPCWARVDPSRSWAGKYAGALSRVHKEAPPLPDHQSSRSSGHLLSPVDWPHHRPAGHHHTREGFNNHLHYHSIHLTLPKPWSRSPTYYLQTNLTH